MILAKDKLDHLLSKMRDIYVDVYGKDIVKVLLYGSYARNEQNDHSDVDMVAIVKGDRNELYDKLRTVWERGSDLTFDMDLVISSNVISYDDYISHRESLPYYMNIEKDGVEIVA